MTTMTAPSTPPAAPRKSRRVRTPPGPQHGSYNNDWEPHGSPRRSTRSSLTNNPYSTLNTTNMKASGSEKGTSNGVPPLRTGHARKTSFWQLSDLISPPSSPNLSDVKNKNASNLGRTPRKQVLKTNNNNVEAISNAPPSASNDTYTSFSLKSSADSPFDIKPARKGLHTNGMKDTARILRFQPADPNDCFPTKRQTLKQRKHDAQRLNNFALDVDSSHGMDISTGSQHNVNIYTDMHARVPELDDSEENVFYRPSTRSRARTHPQPRVSSFSSPDSSPARRLPTPQQVSDAREMQRAVENGEGTIQMFRGRKIFHRFEDVSASSPHISKSLGQRSLRHAAGAAADRPMTRSSIQPRLLFPVSVEEAETDIDDDNVEAETDAEVQADEDVEMSDAPEEDATFVVPATPAKGKGRAKPLMLETPPTTGRVMRMKHVQDDMPDGSALTYEYNGTGAANTPNSRKTKRFALVEIAGDDGDDELDNHNDGLMRPPPTPARRGAARKQESTESRTDIAEDEEPGPSCKTKRTNSLFDLWPRTKSGGRKRDGEAMSSSVIKRTTRSAKGGEETST